MAGDRLTLLLQQGLTEYQARAYVALLGYTSLPAGPVAKAADIPRNRLYEVLEELQTLGLVEILLDEPRRYRARPFRDYLDRKVQRLRDEIVEIEAKRDALTKAMEPPAENEERALDSGSTRVVVGRAAVLHEIERMVEEAKISFTYVASVGGAERAVRHLASLRDRLQPSPERPNFRAEIWLPRAAAISASAERLAEALAPHVRWLPFDLKSVLAVTDHEQFLLVQPVPDDSVLHQGRDFGIFSTNPAFVLDLLQLVRRAGHDGAAPALDAPAARAAARPP